MIKIQHAIIFLIILFFINTSFADNKEVLNEDTADYHIKLAESYIAKLSKENNSDYLSKAIEEYSKAITLKSNDASLYIYRGYLYEMQGNKENAIDDYNKTIELEPDKLQGYFHRAGLYESNDDIENALKDYEKAISLNPNIALFYYQRGKLYKTKKLYGEAINDFSMAIKLKPDSAATLKSISRPLLLFKPIADDNINQKKTLSEYYSERGTCYSYSSQPDEAIADIEQSILLYPSPEIIYTILELLYIKQNRLNDGIKFYSKIISLRKKESQNYYQRAWIYILLKQSDKAIEDLTTAIKMNPEYYYYSYRASLYKDKKQYVKAINDYSKAIELHAEKNYYLERAMLYVEIKSYENALKDYESAIALEPNDPFLYFSRGYINNLLDNNTIALSDFSKACELEKQTGAKDNDTSYCDTYEEYKKEISRGKRWVKLGSGNNSNFYYDKTNINRQANKHIRVWIRTEYDDISKLIEDRKAKYYNIDGYNKHSYRLISFEYDCIGGNVGTITSIDYNESGDVLESKNNLDSLKMTPIAPGTIADSLYKIVCNDEINKPQK